MKQIHTFWVCIRRVHISLPVTARARTLESRPVPGSEEHLNPTGWAKRLFDLFGKQRNDIGLSGPPLLHMVCRLKPLKGARHYERAILERYGVGGDVKRHTWRLVKNVPSVNNDLQIVKHLIRIQPVIFPQGIPSESEDLSTYRLLPDGRFVKNGAASTCGQLVYDIGSITPCNKDVAPIPLLSETPKAYLTRKYLRQWYSDQWARKCLLGHFFSSSYRYKLNQDGSEYRYNRLWRLDDAMSHAVRAQHNSDGTIKPPNYSRFEANWSTYPWQKF